MAKSRSDSPVNFLHSGLPLARGKPLIMGVLNITPDSFSDGGLFAEAEKAVEHALFMAANGAHIIDIGGESTRPGAKSLSPDEESDRVLPVIEALRKISDVFISVDTSTAQVMKEARSAGANMINDIRALKREGALEAAAELDVPVCLMHMKGEPENMQNNPVYRDLLSEISMFFEERIAACIKAGIRRNQLVLDPGFGFGKTAGHNFSILKHLDHFRSFGLPLLAGLSRKSSIGWVTGRETSERLAGSLAGAVMAVINGADIIRVHDVRETVDAMKVVEAVLSAE